MDPTPTFFKNCTNLYWIDTGYNETVFDDKTKVPAMPQDTPTYRWTAKDLGYEDDLKKLCYEHEILHTFLSEQCGLDYSPTLWAVAHNFQEGTIPLNLQYEEEALVLSFQKFLNTHTVEPIVKTFLERNKLKLGKLEENAVGLLR